MIFSITLSFELMLFKLKFKLRIRQEKLSPHTERARVLKNQKKQKTSFPERLIFVYIKPESLIILFVDGKFKWMCQAGCPLVQCIQVNILWNIVNNMLTNVNGFTTYYTMFKATLAVKFATDTGTFPRYTFRTMSNIYYRTFWEIS